MRTILFAIAAMFMTVTVAEANPWREFRAEQRAAYAAGAQSHYWDGVSRGRHVGMDIASRAINSAASTTYLIATGERLTGTVQQKAQKLADALSFHNQARNSLLQAFPSSKRGHAEDIYFRLRDGIIDQNMAWQQWGALMIVSDNLTAGGLNLNHATDAQLVAEGGGVSRWHAWQNAPITFTQNTCTISSAGCTDTSLNTYNPLVSTLVDDIPTAGYALSVTGVLHSSVTLSDGRVITNFANITEADQAELTAMGYICLLYTSPSPRD